MSQDSIVNPNDAVYADGHLSLDFVNQSVTLDGFRVPLTRKEYQLLAHMAQHAGEIVPRDALLTEVWGYGPDMKTRTIDVHVRAFAGSLATMRTGASRQSLAWGTAFNRATRDIRPKFQLSTRHCRLVTKIPPANTGGSVRINGVGGHSRECTEPSPAAILLDRRQP